MIAQSLRCIYCEIHWPPIERYRVCPRCRETTAESWQDGMNLRDAHVLARTEEFGWELLNQWMREGAQEN